MGASLAMRVNPIDDACIGSYLILANAHKAEFELKKILKVPEAGIASKEL